MLVANSILQTHQSLRLSNDATFIEFEGFDLAILDRAQALHTIIESESTGICRSLCFLGNPEYVDVPIAGLLREEYAAERRSLISNTAPNRRVIAFGSPGGSTIITTILGIAFNVFDFDLPLDEAIAAPRISQRNGGVTQVDSGFETSELRLVLTELGHVLEPVAEIGAVTGIVIDPNRTVIAVAEPTRRGGSVQTVEN